MSSYLSRLNNFFMFSKTLPLILLSAFILVFSGTHAKQSGENSDNKLNSFTNLNNSKAKKKASDKKLSQTLLHEQAEEKKLQEEIKKATHKSNQKNITHDTGQTTSSNRLIDESTKKSFIDQQKLNTSAQLKAVDTEVLGKSKNNALKITKTEIVVAQGNSAEGLENSEIIAEVPKAKNVDLEKPISESDIVPPVPLKIISETAPESAEKTEVIIISDPVAEIKDPNSEEQVIVNVHDQPFLLLGAEVPPATSTRLAWSPNQSFKGISAPTPVLVVNGVKAGPVLCLTAAIHGDELNGIEIVRRVLYNLDVEELSGTVIGVPIVNLQGFRRTSRYLSDRRDLNRFFPGNPDGSSASRIAYSFFHEIITHCDALVDLHTGSFHRTNLPQLRADLKKTAVVEITQGFGATVILQSTGAKGTLRRAAVDVGIPAVTLEAGEPMRLQEDQVSHGVKGIHTLLNQMGMYDYSSFWGDPEPIYYKSKWVRANQGGILFSQVKLGKKVKKGDILGSITDPITNVRKQVTSPYHGRIIGMALNQVVMPGFAAFHVGIQTTEEEVADKSADLADATAEQSVEKGIEKNHENIVKIQKKILKVDETENLEDSE